MSHHLGVADPKTEARRRAQARRDDNRGGSAGTVAGGQVAVKQFFLEGEIEGTPGIVRWFVLRPTDGTLRWFDEECVQEMLLSNMATEMFSRLAVKGAAAQLPSMP